jgi:hypothetical protein
MAKCPLLWNQKVTCQIGRNTGRTNANASAKDALLNKKSHGIFRNGHLQKIAEGRVKCRHFHRGCAAKEEKPRHLPEWSSAEHWERQGKCQHFH